MGQEPDPITSIIAGAVTGIVLDLTLYPLDTIKTRLQSKSGFFKTGGFSGVYKGVCPVLIGSAPTAALFWLSYNGVKNSVPPIESAPVVNDMIAAICAEIIVASIRVPIEIVKQRRQVADNETSTISIIKALLQHDGVVGFYRGYPSTICREIPFSLIQYPLWEWLKKDTTQPWQVALCGAVAGGVAAAATTPMDVVKTRVMLAEELPENTQSFWDLHSHVAKEIFKENGILGFYSGMVPRVLWMSIGGLIYFGVYDFVVHQLSGLQSDNSTTTETPFR